MHALLLLAGTCIFTWDNSYSWVNPKTLVYSIELTYEVDEADDSERQHARCDDAVPVDHQACLASHVTPSPAQRVAHLPRLIALYARGGSGEGLAWRLARRCHRC